MVDNIQEIEPVVIKESALEKEEEEDDELQHPDKNIDPAQMKLEL
jgi:hypothetical protein